MTHNSLFYTNALSQFQDKMDSAFEIHESTAATQNPLDDIKMAASITMEPSVDTNTGTSNPMDSATDINKAGSFAMEANICMDPLADINTPAHTVMNPLADTNTPIPSAMNPPADIKTAVPSAIDKEAAKEDEERIIDSNPPETYLRNKFRRIKYGEDKESDLPDTDAKLTDDQISSLFSKRPEVRKRYPRYFSKSCGRIRSHVTRLLFERDENGKLRDSEDVLRSNLQNWQVKLRRFEHPEEFTKTVELRPQGYTEEHVTRKRKRPLNEDDTAESSSQPAIKTIRDHTSVIDSAGIGPNSKSVAPVTSALMGVMGKLEIGEHASLAKEDIMQITEWIGRQSLTLQEIVSRSLVVKMPPEPRYILFDLQDALSRAFRICTAYDQEVQFAYRGSDDCLETD